MGAVSDFQEKTQECLTSWVPRSHAIRLVQHHPISICAYGLPNVSGFGGRTPYRSRLLPPLGLKGLPQPLCGVFPQIPTLLQQWWSFGHLPSTVDEDLGVKEKGIWFQMIGQKTPHRYRNGMPLGKGFECSTNTHIFHQHNQRFHQHFHQHIFETPWSFTGKTRTT